MQFLIENFLLVMMAVVSGGMLLWPSVRSRSGGPTLTTLQVTQLINSKNATVVDIRPPDEFAKGSLPNARNLPVDRVKDGTGALKKDRPLIVVCANGTQAGKVAAQLRSSGFNEVFILGGGLAAWREAGMPIRR